MDCEIILQIFSGGFAGGEPRPVRASAECSSKAVSFEAVEEKLTSVLPRLPASKVIMGWAADKPLYEKTAAFLAKRNIDYYLWFPVFSETGKLKNQSPLVDFWGEQLETAKGHGGEDFSFCCPNNPQNIENVIAIFEKEFAAIPFTGVFLDKIRYPSFAQSDAGLRNVFSCFCPHCKAQYAGLVIDPLSAPLGVTGYAGNGKYVFENAATARFLQLKAASISNGMERICRYFRDKGYGIGLDVFAPFLSPFVGQDLISLSGLCDFMKPMMYRHTNAPAGLPFEMEALLRAAGAQGKSFHDVLGLDLSKKVFDLDFTVKELERLVSFSACPIYAGLEINRKKNVAEINPDYIEESIKAYAGAGIRGLVLSWDLLDAPEENVAKAADVISRIEES